MVWFGVSANLDVDQSLSILVLVELLNLEPRPDFGVLVLSRQTRIEVDASPVVLV